MTQSHANTICKFLNTVEGELHNLESRWRSLQRQNARRREDDPQVAEDYDRALACLEEARQRLPAVLDELLTPLEE